MFRFLVSRLSFINEALSFYSLLIFRLFSDYLGVQVFMQFYCLTASLLWASFFCPSCQNSLCKTVLFSFAIAIPSHFTTFYLAHNKHHDHYVISFIKFGEAFLILKIHSLGGIWTWVEIQFFTCLFWDLWAIFSRSYVW